MRNFIFIAAIALVVGLSAPAGKIATGSPQDLESYVGKYPSMLLKDVPSVRTRLRRVLGGNYNFFMSRMQTEMQIWYDDGCLVAVGCMAHSCGSEDAVMVINLSNGTMHCAIRSGRFNGGYKVYSEDKQNVPQALYNTMVQY